MAMPARHHRHFFKDDLGEHDRQIPSLRAVVYVWQDQRRIEVRDALYADAGAPAG